MTVTFSLPPEVEARLRERAAAAGKDVATLVREAVEEKLLAGERAAGPARSVEQWEQEFDSWVRGRPPVAHPIDDSRESIYAGRGE